MTTIRKLLGRISYTMIRGSEHPQSSFLPDGRRLRGVMVAPGIVLARDGKFYALGNASQSVQLSLQQVLQVARPGQIENALRRIIERARRYGVRRRRARATS